SGHTRSKRDWSSDVCSSDLTKFRVIGGIDRNSAGLLYIAAELRLDAAAQIVDGDCGADANQATDCADIGAGGLLAAGLSRDIERSEERRVGGGGGVGGRGVV